MKVFLGMMVIFIFVLVVCLLGVGVNALLGGGGLDIARVLISMLVVSGAVLAAGIWAHNNL